MCQKQSKQLSGSVSPGGVDLSLQYFVKCFGIARTKILLRRNKGLTAAAFTTYGGCLRFLPEEESLIGQVNDRGKQQLVSGRNPITRANRQRHYIRFGQLCSRLAPDQGRL